MTVTMDENGPTPRPEGEEVSGPWRATRLWNDIIRTLRSGLPLRKQKKGLRTYEDCIGSVELIDWLHKSLQKNVNFGPDVTRDQTVQLLKKLYRAGVLENVKHEDENAEFKETGELYRLALRSPVKSVRSPVRKVLGDVNTNMDNKQTRQVILDEAQEKEEIAKGKRKREKSAARRVKEKEVRKQLNLSYFQSLPSNSLIILDNEGTWRQVFCAQLAKTLSPHHVTLLERLGLLHMEAVMHNMTRVSAKGIVQVEDKEDDLPHWVLSAMKCLANWPRQLRTQGGKESCLPSYPGFEGDVFNVVKDYFLTLPEPLTTTNLFDFFLDAWVKAEAVSVARAAPEHKGFPPGCDQHPGSARRRCTRPYTVTDVDSKAADQIYKTSSQSRVVATDMESESTSQFYTMSENGEEEFPHLSSQERVARIRQTFSVLPPLATSSMKGSTTNSSNMTSNSSNSTFFSNNGSSSLSPDATSTSMTPRLTSEMSTTAIMRNFLPPNTCFETVFMESSPVTRIVPQSSSEVLHLSRSSSQHSLAHISSGPLPTRHSATQTGETKSESLKRLPKWRRSSRLRKSVAVMERSPEMKQRIYRGTSKSSGLDNLGFSTESRARIRSNLSECDPRDLELRRGPCSASELGASEHLAMMNQRHAHSLDNLLDKPDRQDFLLKYRQVSGDLRNAVSGDLRINGQQSQTSENFPQPRDMLIPKSKDSSMIMSKAMRKEKRKSKARESAMPNNGDGILVPALGEMRLEPPHCYDNQGMDESPRAAAEYIEQSSGTWEVPQAPLATQECDLSPVPTQGLYPRLHQYNASYRRATLQISSSPKLPRTSTRLSLPRPAPPPKPKPDVIHAGPQGIYRPVPDAVSSYVRQSDPGDTGGPHEPVYTIAGPGPLRRYPAPLQRSATQRASCHSSVGTVDSGRWSMPPAPRPMLPSQNSSQPSQDPTRCVTQVGVNSPALSSLQLLALLLPPASRRKLQLLLKFILKISLNSELTLDKDHSNAALCLATFLPVVLRGRDPTYPHRDLARPILQFFLDHYEEVWSPPQCLRKEVEEEVYKSLVNKRLAAGEDPYPVTYCEQVTRDQYQSQSQYGSQSALWDLLEAILTDSKMSEKQKRKKLSKFKEGYPDMWRRRFPSPESEPCLKDKASSTFPNLSRLRSAIRM